MKIDDRVSKLAHLEINSWKYHHRRDKANFIKSLTQFYSLKFVISSQAAKEAALLWVKAATLHDEAEKYEDQGSQDQANVYWNEAEKYLKQHHEILEGLK